MTDSAPLARADDPAIARRRGFVIAATEAFFARGYGGTTMSSIASDVGGSKSTLWSYFPSKEELFAAVVDDIVERYGEALSVALPPDEPVELVLRRYAHALLSTIYSEPILKLQRLVVGEATRFPHLASLFYERGPRRGKQRLEAYFAALIARGKLRAGDAAIAVDQFAGLCQTGEYQRALLDLGQARDARITERETNLAVTAFLRIWSA
ncbi:TetR/AcrR family transcriptional regulator [Sphingobium chungangianum]